MVSPNTGQDFTTQCNNAFLTAQKSPMRLFLSRPAGWWGSAERIDNLGDLSGVSFWLLVADVDPGSTLQGLTAPKGGGLLRPREELCPSRAMRHRWTHVRRDT